MEPSARRFRRPARGDPPERGAHREAAPAAAACGMIVLPVERWRFFAEGSHAVWLGHGDTRI